MPTPDDTPRIPHDLEAERALLGAALCEIPNAVDAVATLPPNTWYKPAHGHIAHAITQLTTTGHPTDTITVADHLRRDHLLDTIGGAHNLIVIQGAAGGVAHPPTHARILADLAARRRVITLAHDLTQLAHHADPGTALLSARDLLDTEARTAQRTTNLEIPDMTAILNGNLDVEPTTILTRGDGLSLLYPGRLHAFWAEPESGKSWLALAAAAEVLAAGAAVIYIDYEDTPRGIVGRMLALGATPADLIDRFTYIRPLDTWGPAETAQLAELVDTTDPDLVIIDGIAEALQRDGLDENSAVDWVAWTERIARPIARTGAAVLMLDHVVKNPEQRGRHGRGTGAKLGSIDGAAYELRTVRPFSRNTPGTLDIYVSKDRPGYVRGDNRKVAVANITPHGAGARVDVELHHPDDAPPSGFRPTGVMEALSRVLEVGDLDPKAAAAHMPRTKRSTFGDAVAALTTEGYIDQRRDQGKPVLHSIRPYRRTDDRDAGNRPEPDPQPALDF